MKLSEQRSILNRATHKEINRTKLSTWSDLLVFTVTRGGGNSAGKERYDPDKHVKYDSTVRNFHARTRNIFGLR